MSNELREKVASAIAVAYNDGERFMVRSNRLKVADRILDIPEIREALAYTSPSKLLVTHTLTEAEMEELRRPGRIEMRPNSTGGRS